MDPEGERVSKKFDFDDFDKKIAQVLEDNDTHAAFFIQNRVELVKDARA